MRRNSAPHRELIPDPRYQNVLVSRLINTIMHGGKKGAARHVVYDAFDTIKERIKKNPVEVFDAALANVGPNVELKARRVGGANYQIPIEVRGERKVALAMRWIIDAAKSKKGMAMQLRLANELIEASQKTGAAMKKREDTHRMAEANKAFAHFAW
ncbi:MAG: 30S ribosomal protein S7 [Candidatus Andersenbacteria bacterium]